MRLFGRRIGESGIVCGRPRTDALCLIDRDRNSVRFGNDETDRREDVLA